jgi:hypothetical protein
MEKMNEIRKSLDQRWRQLDKFETSVKQYADTKTTWRRKLSAKEGELEATKVVNSPMQTNILFWHVSDSRRRRPYRT